MSTLGNFILILCSCVFIFLIYLVFGVGTAFVLSILPCALVFNANDERVRR